MEYTQLTLRNASYIDASLQSRLRKTRLLLAGCGLGAVVAEVAARTGFERLRLVDGDRVAPHNLNRQVYLEEDIGLPKAEALARRLRGIHREMQVEVHTSWLSAGNAPALVEGCDLVIDTVDFLDLPAVVALHDEAARQGKPVISGFACGWGAVGALFLPGGATLREVFGLPRAGAVGKASYPELFRRGMRRLAPELPRAFVAATAGALDGMAEGRPCPAPQLAVGAHCAAALLVTQVVRWLAGEPLTPAPALILVDLASAVSGAGLWAAPVGEFQAAC